MTISGINGNTNIGAGATGIGNSNMDSYSKNLKKQIEDAQKELQELAGDKEMDPDTKMKRRQEIQKQISDLNMQLRQHQMEERRKAQQEKQQQNQQKSQEKKQAGKSEEKSTGLSQNNMQAMLSAEGALKQAKIHGSTANKMENESDIKRTEIKLEGGGSTRSANDNAVVSKKWDEVEGMEQKAQAAAASQASLLAEAQDKLDKANEEGSTDSGREEKSGKKFGVKARENLKEIKDSQEKNDLQNAKEAEEINETKEAEESEETKDATAPAAASSHGHLTAIGINVDIRL